MKSHYPLSALSVALLSLGATSAQAITLEDYVDPNSRYEDAYINGSFRAANESANNTADANGGAAAPAARGNSFDLNLTVDYDRVNSTRERVRTVSANIGGSLSNDDAGTRDEIGANASLTYDKYFGQNPNTFWYGGALLDYDPNSAEELAADITLGLGYGRVVNATPLAKALRLVEEFQRFGLVSAYPSDDVMLRIAQIINKEREYESRLGSDDYRTGWYQDIEAEFSNAGILADEGLGALGVIKIDQVLTEESVSTRKHGWVARAGATAVIQDHEGNNGDPAFSIGFEYAKPYGYRGQLINQATYRIGDSSSFSNELSYTYEISNNIDWESKWDLDLQQPDRGEDILTNRLSSGFAYEITNLLTLNTGLSITDRDNDDDSAAALFETTLKYRLK